MAFVDWYVPQLPKKTRNEKKALQCLSQDDDKALRQLLESGLDPDMKIRYWSSDRTLFHIALVANHANKCVKTLFEFGCDIEDNFDGPAIFHCINDPNMLEVLLKFGKQDPNQMNPNGSTPLIEAVNSNNFKSVQMLIKYGANLDQMDFDNKTPLIHACSNDFQNLDILEFLCRHGSDALLIDPKSRQSVLKILVLKMVLAPMDVSQKYLNRSFAMIRKLLQNLDEFSRLELLDFHGSSASILHLVLKNWNENRVQHFAFLLDMILDFGANDHLPFQSNSEDLSLLSLTTGDSPDLELGNTALLDWVLIHGTPTSAKILLRRGYLLNYPWVSVPLILEQENLPMLQCMIQSQQSLQPFALTYTKSFSNSLFQHEVQHFLKSPQSLKSLCRMQVRQLHDYDSEFVPKQLVRFLEFQWLH